MAISAGPLPATIACIGSDARFMGGVQGGFDYQFAPNCVMGVEAQYSWLNSNTTGFAFPGRRPDHLRNNQIGSVTGRAGYTWGPGLIYAKGGYAWRDNPNIGVSVGGAPVTFATDGNHRDGWTVGGGLEYMFAPTGRPRPNTSTTISATPTSRLPRPSPAPTSATTIIRSRSA